MIHDSDGSSQSPRSGVRLLVVLLIASATSVAAAGCRSVQSADATSQSEWDLGEAIGWKSEELPPPPETPARLVATWTHTVKHTPGSTPVRGFGGRILFFGPHSENPVRVDGQLVVYAFDEDNRESYDTQPSKRFIYPAEQFGRHESESKLGPSYSIWIPWDAVGGDQKNISLITRFEPRGGPVVLGEQTRHLLPGVPQQFVQPSAPTTSQGERSIMLTGHAQEIGNNIASSSASTSGQNVSKAAAKDLNGTTILIPKSLKEQIAHLRQARSDSTAVSRLKRRVTSTPTMTQRLRQNRDSDSSNDQQSEDSDDKTVRRGDSRAALMGRTSAVDSTKTTAMSHRPSSQRSTDFSLPKRRAQ